MAGEEKRGAYYLGGSIPIKPGGSYLGTICKHCGSRNFHFDITGGKEEMIRNGRISFAEQYPGAARFRADCRSCDRDYYFLLSDLKIFPSPEE